MSTHRVFFHLLFLALLVFPAATLAAGAVQPMPTGLSPTPAWVDEGDQSYAWFGNNLGAAGDVNGDGYADIIVGAVYYDNGQTDEGAAFVYYGSPTGPSPLPSWMAEGDQAGCHFGVSVGTAGDVNGDGYDDILIGAYDCDNGQTNEGRAFLYYGSATGPSSTPDWTAESDQAYAQFGVRLGPAGDVNGDGYADVVVGARYYDNGQPDEGRAYAYYGSPEGLSLSPNWIAEGNRSNSFFGRSVNTAGDVDGDGYDDVIVGADRYDNGQTDEGQAYLYYGSAAGLVSTPAWTFEANLSYAHLGVCVGTAGDVNDDGYSDVLVGAEWYGNGQSKEGAVYAFYGSPTGLSSAPDWMTETDQAGAMLGFVLSTAGDVNGDGFGDVILSALQHDNAYADEGRVYAYYGSADGLSSSAGWMVDGGQAGAILGDCVDGVGDVNGDGIDDVLAGAAWYDSGHVDEGQAYLYVGSGDSACDPPHDAEFTWSPANPQAGHEVIFSANAAGTPPFDYAWQFGDGSSGAGSPIAHVYAEAGIYNVTLVVSNACGQAAVDDNITVLPSKLPVFVDIKPTSCPNPLNVHDQGVLPVAILGTTTFDVTTIDPASIRLEGVPVLEYSYEDVTTPVYDPVAPCECTTAGPDGYTDLVLHLDAQAIIAALLKPSLIDARLGAFIALPGHGYTLTLQALLWNGGAVVGQDCIILLDNYTTD